MGKVAILGLGPSIKLFDGTDFSIGVNDVWRYHKSEIVVCVDHPNTFKKWPDRLRTINDCRPDIFYSQIAQWDYRKDFRKLTLLPGYPDKSLRLEAGIWKSFCSPFIAVQVAYHFHRADHIHVYGVDLLDHPHLDREICRKIHHHFRNLFFALQEKNIKITVHGDGILKNLLQ